VCAKIIKIIPAPKG